MEGLTLVQDASEKAKRVKDTVTGKYKETPILKPGYPLRVAIALSPTGNLLPLELSLLLRRLLRFELQFSLLAPSSIYTQSYPLPIG